MKATVAMSQCPINPEMCFHLQKNNSVNTWILPFKLLLYMIPKDQVTILLCATFNYTNEVALSVSRLFTVAIYTLLYWATAIYPILYSYIDISWIKLKKKQGVSCFCLTLLNYFLQKWQHFLITWSTEML